jgi:hypothetical protein
MGGLKRKTMDNNNIIGQMQWPKLDVPNKKKKRHLFIFLSSHLHFSGLEKKPLPCNNNNRRSSQHFLGLSLVTGTTT